VSCHATTVALAQAAREVGFAQRLRRWWTGYPARPAGPCNAACRATVTLIERAPRARRVVPALFRERCEGGGFS
jgi:hypothetical protein